MAGGVTGALIAVVGAMMARRFRVTDVYLGMLTLSIAHVVNMILETFAYQVYKGIGGVMIVQVTMLSVWLGLYLFFMKREAQIPD